MHIVRDLRDGRKIYLWLQALGLDQVLSTSRGAPNI